MPSIKYLFALVAFIAFSPASMAVCVDTKMVNPVSDVVWDCMFPITIASVPIDMGNHPPDNEKGEFLCSCSGKGYTGQGFLITYWEPARMLDTSADPGCFPALGRTIDVGGGSDGYKAGGTLENSGSDSHAFQHYHFYIYPILELLNMFLDMGCNSGDSVFDIAVVSEIRPDWSNDFVAAQWYPETSLIANVGPVLACIADAVAATIQRPIDALYWCMGAWGVTYPMSGHIPAMDYVAANAGIAAKAMTVQARMFGLNDRAINYCTAVPSPIWVKSHWRIQQVDPVVANRCMVIGYPGLLWTSRKNPVGRGDSFSWLLFRKVRCCVVF